MHIVMWQVPGLAICPVAVVNTLVAIVAINRKASHVYLKSKEIISLWWSQVGGAKKSWRAKFVRSCAPMKVRFASNFIDQLTPLMSLSLCVNETVRLLLLSA